MQANDLLELIDMLIKHVSTMYTRETFDLNFQQLIDRIKPGAYMKFAPVSPGVTRINIINVIVRRAILDGWIDEIVKELPRNKPTTEDLDKIEVLLTSLPKPIISDPLLKVLRDGNSPVDDRLPSVATATQWPPRCYELIDRKEQVGTFRNRLPLRAGRASLIVWCGDNLARHDLMYSRMITASVRFPVKEVKADADAPRTFLLKDNVKDSLDFACNEFFQEDWRRAYLRGSCGSGRMIHIQCNMDWDTTTVRKLQQIQEWCEALGDIGSDRCFVVAIAIKVQLATGLWANLTKFWTKSLDQLIGEARLQIEQSEVGEKVILLPYLEELTPGHLGVWTADMQRQYGKPLDDRFGEDKLQSLFPSTEATLPMATVIDKVKELLPPL